jgi:hypothetical protein
MKDSRQKADFGRSHKEEAENRGLLRPRSELHHFER